jgi:hypothetical protein
MPIEYFEKLFHYIFSLLEKYYTPKDHKRFNIVRFDSTMVGLSAKLLHGGMKGLGDPNKPKTPRHQVKFSVGFNGTCAVSAKAFFEQIYYSEDIALAEVISETDFKKNDVLVFDRGLSGKEQLKKLTLGNIQFVGRLKAKTACVDCGSLPFGYNGSICASVFGLLVPVISVQIVPLLAYSRILFRFNLCHFIRSS